MLSDTFVLAKDGFEGFLLSVRLGVCGDIIGIISSCDIEKGDIGSQEGGFSALEEFVDTFSRHFVEETLYELFLQALVSHIALVVILRGAEYPDDVHARLCGFLVRGQSEIEVIM